MEIEIETIEIHGESSTDWQATAVRYIELHKQKTEAIQRVRELHYKTDGGYCHCCCQGSIECEPIRYPCPTIKALDGDD
jgi:hypothetical protein